ncbi:hypothetical protein ACI65C_005696 [Semiaphis heraclei]
MEKMTSEDIENYKLSLIQNKNNTLNEDSIILKDVKTPKDVKTSEGDKTSIDDGPAEKKQKLNTNEIDVLKLVLSRDDETHNFRSQYKSSLKPESEVKQEPIASTSTEYSAQSIWVADYAQLMTDANYKKWLQMYKKQKNYNEVTNGTNNLEDDKPSTSEPNSNGVARSFNGKCNKNGQLIKYENLYQKYFSKSVQDTIVIIANTLNIITIVNKRYLSRIDESFEKKTEAEKLKERCDAHRLYERHNKVLHTKLKGYFTDVVSVFTDLEFHSAFQLFFLCILKVHQILNQLKFKRGIFKNLALLLRRLLKNSNYQNEKVYEMFRANHFITDCIDVISIIEDSRDVDPGVIHRMPLFFVSNVSSLKYFQPLIHAVTKDSKEDLEILIDHASYQTRLYSKFKDPVQMPVNSDGTIQEWHLAQYPDGTYQYLPVINVNKSKTIGNIAPESSNATSQTLNNFYESFSSTLPKKTHEPSTSKTIPSNKCFVITPNISYIPLVQVIKPFTVTATSTSTTTFGAFNSSIKNEKPMVNIPLIKAEGGTFVIGNNQIYQLVNSPPSQMRATANGSNNIISVISPQTNEDECVAKNCNVKSKIMCSACSSAKYCSEKCQEADWGDSHIFKCGQGSINKM